MGFTDGRGFCVEMGKSVVEFLFAKLSGMQVCYICSASNSLKWVGSGREKLRE